MADEKEKDSGEKDLDTPEITDDKDDVVEESELVEHEEADQQEDIDKEKQEEGAMESIQATMKEMLQRLDEVLSLITPEVKGEESEDEATEPQEEKTEEKEKYEFEKYPGSDD